MSDLPSFLPGADTTIAFYGWRYPTRPHLPEQIFLKVSDRLDWESYFDGTWAPHLTIAPNHAHRKLKIRQHYHLDRTARMTQAPEVPHISIVLLGAANPRTIEKMTLEHSVFINWPIAPPWVRHELLDVLEWLATHLGPRSLGGHGVDVDLLSRELAKRLGAPIDKDADAARTSKQQIAAATAAVAAIDPGKDGFNVARAALMAKRAAAEGTDAEVKAPTAEPERVKMTKQEALAKARAVHSANAAKRRAELEAAQAAEQSGRI